MAGTSCDSSYHCRDGYPCQSCRSVLECPAPQMCHLSTKDQYVCQSHHRIAEAVTGVLGDAQFSSGPFYHPRSSRGRFGHPREAAVCAGNFPDSNGISDDFKRQNRSHQTEPVPPWVPRVGASDPGVPPRPVPLSQERFAQLATWQPRQFVGEIHAAGALEGRDPLPAVGDQLASELRCGGDPGGNLDDRLHLFAEFLMRHANDGHVEYRGMHDENIFDLLRVDVHATGDDRVGDPVGEEEIALLVEVADVPEGAPTLGVEGFRRLDWVVVVLERPPSLEPDGARLAWWQLLASGAEDVHGGVLRAAHRPRVGEPLLGADGDKAIALAARVVLVDDRAPPR